MIAQHHHSNTAIGDQHNIALWLPSAHPVSYTHLTLPTIYSV